MPELATVMFGFKLLLFGLFIQLDICPFYWRAFIKQVEMDVYSGIVVACGPIYFEVLT